MTNVHAIHSVGESLAAYLNNTYPEALRDRFGCQFRLVSSGEMADAGSEFNQTTLTLYLYRVTMNEHLRGTRRAVGSLRTDQPLSVDLHYLLTVWANNAPEEQVILAWAMRQLHQHPVLDQASLSPDAEWGPGEYVQVIPAELSTEDIMRIWDAFDSSYRLSVSYIARVVRIDGEGTRELPHVATRLELSSRALVGAPSEVVP